MSESPTATEPRVPSAGRTTPAPSRCPSLPPSLGALFSRPGRRRPGPRGVPRPDRRRRLGVVELGAQRRARDRARRRPALARACSPRSASRSRWHTRLEWIFADLAVMARRRRHHHGLPLDQRRGRRLHPQRLRLAVRRRRGRRASSPSSSSSAMRSPRRREGRPRRHLGVDLSARARRLGHHLGRPRRPGPCPAGLRRRRRRPRQRRRHPDQPRHAHLHLGHHRSPQGRRAHARATGPTRPPRSRVSACCGRDQLQFLWLPLSHSFGKVLLSAQLQIGFTSAVDGRVDKIVDNLAIIKPNFMAGAPRIFEKVYARVVSMQAAEGGAKEKIFNWAIGVGKQVADAQAQGHVGLADPRRAARASPTGSCSPRSATGSAATSSTSCPARPRCPRTSASGSRPSASSSSRATASPRPRRARSSDAPARTAWARWACRSPAPR